MSDVQRKGELLAEEHGFLGVPTKTFDEGGRRQIISLLREGLSPESKVLEIGMGPLRVAYWLIRLLDPQGYAGIEPHSGRVRWSAEALFPRDMLEHKQPRFDFNADFNTDVFDDKFDFFLAGSIWTHCAKNHIRTMLDGFVRNTVETGVFLVSYLPPRTEDEEYWGETWVGTSHESNTPGIVRHSFTWIEAECQARGLRVEEVPGHAFDSQFWLKIMRQDVPDRPERITD